MRIWHIIKIIFVSFFIAVTAQCFGTEPAQAHNTKSIGGTGSEVVGVVNYPDSSNTIQKTLFRFAHPMEHAGVFIHPKNYLAEINQTTELTDIFTSQDGSFRISNVLPGEHLVYINDGNGMAIAKRITVPDDSITLDLGLLIAQRTASVQTQYQGTMPGKVLFYVSVRGTGLSVRCTDRNINTLLTDIPTGLTDGYTITVRMLQPFNKGKDFKIPTLEANQLYQLQPFKDF